MKIDGGSRFLRGRGDVLKVCIICNKDVTGKRAVRVKDDFVIRTIRRVKQILGVAKNNELYVCEDDFEEYKKRRSSFEKSIMIFGAMAGLLIFGVVLLMIITGRFSISSIVSLLVLGILLLIFTLVFRFTPAVESEKFKVVR